jgi:hypothetical protein
MTAPAYQAADARVKAEVKKMSRRKRFATIELDQIEHLTVQTEEGESDGAGATVNSKLPIAAERSRPRSCRREEITKTTK